MKVLITIEQLQEKLKETNADIKCINVSNNLTIPHTISLSVKADLTGENSFMPEPEQLAERLGELGISNNCTLVLFDEGSNRNAAKAWVVFHYIGHEKVYILQGGGQSLSNIALPEQPPQIEKTIYKLNVRSELLADIEKVKQELENNDSVLIDSRANERYTGKIEPKYKKAGHIPGAKNYHAKAVFTEDGLYKERGQLQKHFEKLTDKEEIIVSCGSGTSACMNLVALKEAGFKDVKLYSGGFSEWITDEKNEVETD